MQLPLRAIHPFAHVARSFTPEYVVRALDEQPFFTLTEVPDLIGLPCAVDLTVNDSFYITLLLYVVLRVGLWAAARQSVHSLTRERHHPDDDT